jgi:tRNA 2-thiouridine synthesizing protein A
MPVIRAQNQVKTLAPGTLVEVICTDPGALNDIPAWARINGHKVMASHSSGNEFVILLEVGA